MRARRDKKNCRNRRQSRMAIGGIPAFPLSRCRPPATARSRGHSPAMSKNFHEYAQVQMRAFAHRHHHHRAPATRHPRSLPPALRARLTFSDDCTLLGIADLACESARRLPSPPPPSPSPPLPSPRLPAASRRPRRRYESMRTCL